MSIRSVRSISPLVKLDIEYWSSTLVNMPGDIKDKNSEPIKEGDEVWTRFRGGKREGEVEKVVKTEAQASSENVKNPPKAGSPLSTTRI